MTEKKHTTEFHIYEKIIDAFIEKDEEDMRWILLGENKTKLEYLKDLRTGFIIDMKKSIDNWEKCNSKINRLVKDEKVKEMQMRRKVKENV